MAELCRGEDQKGVGLANSFSFFGNIPFLEMPACAAARRSEASNKSVTGHTPLLSKDSLESSCTGSIGFSG